MVESRLQKVERQLNMEPPSILEITRDHEATIDWLFEHNLLKSEQVCPNCEHEVISDK